MLLRWFLFKTKAGELLLTVLEKTTGLAVVEVEWLGSHSSGVPRVTSGE